MCTAENGDLADSNIQINRAAGNITPKFHALSRPEIVEAEATGRAIDIAYAGGSSAVKTCKSRTTHRRTPFTNYYVTDRQEALRNRHEWGGGYRKCEAM